MNGAEIELVSDSLVNVDIWNSDTRVDAAIRSVNFDLWRGLFSDVFEKKL